MRVHPHPKLTARQLTVPGDLSAAVFMIGAALVLPDSSVMLHNVGLNPTRTRVLDFLISIGASINIASVQMREGELVGDLAIRHAPLKGGSISGAQVAEMIDELPMLAALGPYTEQGIEIHDAKELRVKESDRIAALAQGLRQMGAGVEEFADGLRVSGRSAQESSSSIAKREGFSSHSPLATRHSILHGATVDPHGDHRIAMALAVAALGAEGNTTIRGADCAAVSFPEFFTTLDRLRGGSERI